MPKQPVETNPHVAMVHTWNGDDVKWGPMSLEAALKMASDSNYAHRYVEVKGVIVFDYDEVVEAAAHAVRKDKAARHAATVKASVQS